MTASLPELASLLLPNFRPGRREMSFTSWIEQQITEAAERGA